MVVRGGVSVVCCWLLCNYVMHGCPFFYRCVIRLCVDCLRVDTCVALCLVWIGVVVVL